MSTLNGGPGNIVTNGLVLYLDAANYLSYVSGSTSWYDLSGNNNSGSLVNGPTFNSSNAGSIVFDGVDDYVNATNTVNNLPNFTVGCWFKTTSSGQGMLVNKLVNYNNGAGWGLYHNSGDARFIFQTDGSLWGVYSTANLTLTNGAWYNATAVLTNGLLTGMYINGTQVGVTLTKGTQWTTYSNNGNIRIGTSQDNQNRFNGNVASAQIYNRALTATEVLQNYNAQKTRFGLT